MPFSFYGHQQLGRTIGAQEVTLLTYSIPKNTSIRFQIDVLGRDIDTYAGIVIRELGGAKRQNGNASLIGTPRTVFAPIVDPAMGLAAVKVNVSGVDVVISVTGIINKTIDWFGQIELVTQ